MLWSDILDKRARPILNDVESATCDWSTDDLLVWGYDAVLLLAAGRPEARMNDAGAQIALPTAIPTAKTETFPLADLYAAPIADYILARAFSQDAGERRDLERAAFHRNAFLAFIKELK